MSSHFPSFPLVTEKSVSDCRTLLFPRKNQSNIQVDRWSTGLYRKKYMHSSDIDLSSIRQFYRPWACLQDAYHWMYRSRRKCKNRLPYDNARKFGLKSNKFKVFIVIITLFLTLIQSDVLILPINARILCLPVPWSIIQIKARSFWIRHYIDVSIFGESLKSLHKFLKCSRSGDFIRLYGKIWCWSRSAAYWNFYFIKILVK